MDLNELTAELNATNNRLTEELSALEIATRKANEAHVVFSTESARLREKESECKARLATIDLKERELVAREANARRSEDLEAGEISLIKNRDAFSKETESTRETFNVIKQTLDVREAKVSARERDIEQRETNLAEREANYRAEIEREIIAKVDKSK